MAQAARCCSSARKPIFGMELMFYQVRAKTPWSLNALLSAKVNFYQQGAKTP
jgi:hypothetical protein